MDKIEYRAVIKYLCLKKLTPTDIHKDMQETLGDSAPSYAMVKKWCAEFKRGRTSVEDDPRSGRPREATTTEKADLGLDSVMKDRRITIRRLAVVHDISKSSVERILHENLNMNKVSAR